MTEIGWTDQHKDRGHIILGRDEVLEYAPPIAGGLGEDVVGIVEVSAPHTSRTMPVYLTRDIAEILYSALGKELEDK